MIRGSLQGHYVFVVLCILFATTFLYPQSSHTAVWVNTRSGLYHCSGSKWYGHTKEGMYMEEGQAQDEGYSPAGGHWCELTQDANAAPPARARCGFERWPVKILADKDKLRVDFSPTPSTVKSLSALPKPLGKYEYDRRIADAELHVYRIKARLLRVRTEADSDIHLTIADRDAPALSMIAEIPAPFCAVGTGHEDAFSKAREIALRAPLGSLLEIEGVGFFDVIHAQRGRALNGIELHPVLRVSVEH